MASKADRNIGMVAMGSEGRIPVKNPSRHQPQEPPFTLSKPNAIPLLVAMRHNPDLKAKYQAMIKAGKPPKVALTALMRKLIELANALIKANRNWVKKEA